MKISGFSFARNAQQLYYPVDAAIRSVLPICDEFVIAIGRGDEDDRTREMVESIGDPKITIIDTEWADRDRLKGAIHAQQTDIALARCTGDWCFYVQADEVVHEKYLPVIWNRCQELLHDPRIEGLLFDYKHFWGDYDHYVISHKWYPREIRIVRNHLGITSYQTAQSFRLDGEKLGVAKANAEIFHYGWVRPPRLMTAKNREMSRTHHGRREAGEEPAGAAPSFDYGSLERLPLYDEAHPEVMKPWVERMDWRDELQYTGRSRCRHKHDRLKYKVLTLLEQNLLGGELIGGFKNYRLLRDR